MALVRAAISGSLKRSPTRRRAVSAADGKEGSVMQGVLARTVVYVLSGSTGAAALSNASDYNALADPLHSVSRLHHARSGPPHVPGFFRRLDRLPGRRRRGQGA